MVLLDKKGQKKQSLLDWFLGKKPKELPLVEVSEEPTLFQVQPSTEVIMLPEMKDVTTLDVRYPLIPPYAYAHVHWDSKENELFYELEEPVLNEQEKKVLKILEDGIKELINISFLNIKETNKVIEYLEKNLKVLLTEYKINITKEAFLKMMYYLYRNFVGMNEIEPLMNDYFIEDLECNGSQTPIYIVHRKYRHIRTNVIFPDNKVLASFVEKLAQKCGKYISYASPLLDGALPDGSRVNSTYTTDISSRGPTFTIRKFTKEPWTPIKLMDFGTVSPEVLAYLWLLIEHEANMMVIGGTGSGKTSFLNSLAFFIPPAARVVTIEDTRELNLLHENWLPSVARAGVGMATITGERHGEVSLFDLLRESFRQRPDYVIVGEIRGKEAFVLFQGAASGHPTLATMHAESVDTMVKRLETHPIDLSPALVETLNIVCVMVQTQVGGKPVRRLKEVVEIIRVPSEGNAIVNTPFVRDPAKDVFFYKTDSKMLDKISKEQGIPKEILLAEWQRRINLLMAMYRKKMFGFKEVYEVINKYYKTPQEVLMRFGLK
ncbi:MAG: type II/IV secretion system ATPase subunit [Nanoarchaeota archaeon]|nr:type II/IV secretion system ATPase subunit [Nanoarchaeota archaeon]